MSGSHVEGLARSAASGDRAAFTALVAATQTDVWRLCAYLVDRQAADDLAQETFLRAFRAIGRFRSEAPARAWLLTIARRVCVAEIDQRRRARELALHPTRQVVASPDASGRVEVDVLVNALDPDRRLAFVLTQVLGCDYAEAAVVCGCPIGTIRSRVARARHDLITALSARDDTAHAPRRLS